MTNGKYFAGDRNKVNATWGTLDKCIEEINMVGFTAALANYPKFPHLDQILFNLGNQEREFALVIADHLSKNPPPFSSYFLQSACLNAFINKDDALGEKLRDLLSFPENRKEGFVPFILECLKQDEMRPVQNALCCFTSSEHHDWAMKALTKNKTKALQFLLEKVFQQDTTMDSFIVSRLFCEFIANESHPELLPYFLKHPRMNPFHPEYFSGCKIQEFLEANSTWVAEQTADTQYQLSELAANIPEIVTMTHRG